MKIIVLGAGAWGTALAASAAAHRFNAHAVTIWGRDPQQVREMELRRENSRYLPGFALPPSLQYSHIIFYHRF